LPSEPVRGRFLQLELFYGRLLEVAEVENLSEWLERPNPALADHKPADLIRNDQFEPLWGLLADLEG
jgi:hypothetical protein